MKLHPIETGYFKLDGGAMFGVVPKSIWQKSNPADHNNLCTWALRCLLIEDGNKLILIDNGIGKKQSQKFFSHYYLHGDDNLINSIHKCGFSETDITDNFLTHLHFDHCGGGIILKNGKLIPQFKNATYWSNQDHWNWATKPNPREKASFLKENILPMQESAQLEFVDVNQASFGSIFELLFVSGHTDTMMIPIIPYKGRKVCFMADLLPSTGHIPISYIMGYDTRPLISLEEKEKFLKIATDNNYVLFFEHDPLVECCTLKYTEKGIRVDETFLLNEL